MKKRIFIGLIMISLLTGLLFTLVVGAVLPISAQRRVIDSLQQEAAFIRARTPEEWGRAVRPRRATVSAVKENDR